MKRHISISDSDEEAPPAPAPVIPDSQPSQTSDKRLSQLASSILDGSGSSYRDSEHSQSQVPLKDADVGLGSTEIKHLKADDVRQKLKSDPELAREVIEGLATEVDGFCRLSTLRPTKENGYVQLSHDGANKFALLHEVLLWSTGTLCPEGQHISHLCDKPRCVVAHHVAVESPAMNNSRKNCGQLVQCAHCEKKYSCCRHEPRCIVFTEGYTSWEDFVERGLHE